MRPTPIPRPSRPSLFLPREHGSWSLAFEPVVLGLLIAPTLAGAALAVSTTAAFFLRRPIKSLALAPNRAARVAVTLLGACAGIGLIEIILFGGWRPLLLLTPALPLATLFLYWDRQNEARAAQAELAASSIFALVPAVMAAQAGLALTTAMALSAIMLARSLPTILIVRTYLRLRKNQPASPGPATIATLAAVIVTLGLAAYRLAPWTAAALVLLAALRLGLLLPATRPDWPARRIGIGEAIFGVIYIISIAASYP